MRAESVEFAEALSAVGVGVSSWKVRTDEFHWSDAMRKLFEVGGQAPETFDAYLLLLHREDRPRVAKAVREALDRAAESGEPQEYVVEYRLAGAKEVARWIEGRGRVELGADGSPTRVLGTAADVTSRKATEARLRRSEELHRWISELASDYVYVADLRMPLLFPEIVAGSFERTTKMTSAQVEAAGGWWKVVHPDDTERLAASVPLLLAGTPCVTEYRIVDGEGATRWLRDSVRPIQDPATNETIKLVGGVQDITDRKLLEQQLLDAQKLEALARLSGGMAHDFNNLLAVVMATAELIQSEDTSPRVHEAASTILEAALRGSELTKSLLLFARRDGGASQTRDIGQLVRTALPLLDGVVGSEMRVEFLSDAVACWASVDPGQLQLLLLNLFANARDASDAKGVVELRLRVGRFDSSQGLPAELLAGEWIALSVTDHGHGIADELIPRLFEPFFTTKAVGRGTGLGLAACYGVARQAGGGIGVKSSPNGTVFTVFLPSAKAPSATDRR